tara:strand:+ start:263 stop:415 length:153 start_codon:yes stop_codon:yes gene_type:complete
MSTFTDAQKIDQPSLDGANDLRPEVETSIIREHKAQIAKAKAKKKTTTTK